MKRVLRILRPKGWFRMTPERYASLLAASRKDFEGRYGVCPDYYDQLRVAHLEGPAVIPSVSDDGGIIPLLLIHRKQHIRAFRWDDVAEWLGGAS